MVRVSRPRSCRRARYRPGAVSAGGLAGHASGTAQRAANGSRKCRTMFFSFSWTLFDQARSFAGI